MTHPNQHLSILQQLLDDLELLSSPFSSDKREKNFVQISACTAMCDSPEQKKLTSARLARIMNKCFSYSIRTHFWTQFVSFKQQCFDNRILVSLSQDKVAIKTVDSYYYY